jgi:hypothetical protein
MIPPGVEKKITEKEKIRKRRTFLAASRLAGFASQGSVGFKNILDF